MSEFDELLTPREKEVYCRIVNNIEGLSQDELAKSMQLSKYTFKTHIAHIFEKTGTSSQIELIIRHYRKRLEL